MTLHLLFTWGKGWGQSWVLFKGPLRSAGMSEIRSCVKVEVGVLGSPSLTSLMVSVEAKRH